MLESLEAALYPIVVNINTHLSSYILVFLLIGVGLFYSIRIPSPKQRTCTKRVRML